MQNDAVSVESLSNFVRDFVKELESRLETLESGIEGMDDTEREECNKRLIAVSGLLEMQSRSVELLRSKLVPQLT